MFLEIFRVSSENVLPVAGAGASWCTYLLAQAVPTLTPVGTFTAVTIAFFTFGIGVARAIEAYNQYRMRRFDHEERMSGTYLPGRTPSSGETLRPRPGEDTVDYVNRGGKL